MLPAEAFADVVAFLRLFDLSSLAITSAMCSTLAVKASGSIRWEDFSGLQFLIGDNLLEVTRSQSLHVCMNGWAVVWRGYNNDEDAAFDRESVATLALKNEIEMAEFVETAFSNCIVGNIFCFQSKFMDAFGPVADSVVITGALWPPVLMGPS